MIKTILSDSPYTDANQSDDFLEIEIKGLGTLAEEGDGRTVLVEFYDDKWWVRVWADINQEDPTHIIDMSRALQTNRDIPNLEPTHYNCCHAPQDLGHMFGCPNNSENAVAKPTLLDAVEHVLIASENGGDMNDIDWNLLRSAVTEAKRGKS